MRTVGMYVLQLSKKLWSEELCNPDVKTFGGSWRKLFVSKVQATAPSLDQSMRLASGGLCDGLLPDPL